MGLLAIGRWLGALIGRCGGGQAPYPLGQGWQPRLYHSGPVTPPYLQKQGLKPEGIIRAGQ